MNDSSELQHIQIENLLRRHYLHELLLDGHYERLACFMRAVLGIEDTLIKNGMSIASFPAQPQSKPPRE